MFTPKKKESIGNALTFKYKFAFSDGAQKEFVLNLHKRTLALMRETPKSFPKWTELECSKCTNCPLDTKRHKYCPIATALVDVINFFSTSFSVEEVNVVITADQRTYAKSTVLQYAISSLIGIYMVTSGCPIMDKLRPMVRLHLPFSSSEETTFRVMSMYLLAQYFLYKRGKAPDWDLKNLSTIYDDINIVNKCFCQRLRQIEVEDASLNAITNLDCFAQHVSFKVSKQLLEDVECLFDAYFST